MLDFAAPNNLAFEKTNYLNLVLKEVSFSIKSWNKSWESNRYSSSYKLDFERKMLKRK